MTTDRQKTGRKQYDLTIQSGGIEVSVSDGTEQRLYINFLELKFNVTTRNPWLFHCGICSYIYSLWKHIERFAVVFPFYVLLHVECMWSRLWSDFYTDNNYAPFEEGGAYCFEQVGRYGSWSVGRSPPYTIFNSRRLCPRSFKLIFRSVCQKSRSKVMLDSHILCNW